MLVKDLGLKEIRKRYDNSDEFVIKVRDGVSGKDSDKVYYNGIKVFEITSKDEDNDTFKIIASENVYKLNRLNILNAKRNNNDIVLATKNLREKMKDYFPLVLRYIKLESSSTFNEKIDNVKEIVGNLKVQLKKYIDNGVIKTSELNEEYVIGELKKNKSCLINIYNSNGLKIEDMVKIEYIFIDNCVFNGSKYDNRTGLCIPKVKCDDIKKTITKKEFDLFEINLKEAIETYEVNTKMEFEKNYQHQFMVCNIRNKCDLFQDIYKFEEEYYTNESGREPAGRVDNIFIKIDEEKREGEVYLIELKVNEAVIGGTNGVHKHLIDIEKLYRNNKKNLRIFLRNLKNRVNYRRKVLEGKPSIKLRSDKINFWVVIAIAEDKLSLVDNAILVKTRVNDLYDKKYVKDEKKKANNPLPKESKVLNMHIDNLIRNNCDVKIMYDIWNLNKESSKYEISSINFFDINRLNELIKEMKENE